MRQILKMVASVLAKTAFFVVGVSLFMHFYHPSNDTTFNVVKDQREVQMDNLSAQYECGDLPKGTIPAHSLITDLEGNPSIVSFDEGWKMYMTHDPNHRVYTFCKK